MEPINVVLKIILIVFFAVLPFTPLLMEYYFLKRDIKNKSSHKRFRILLSACLYVFISSVTLLILHEAIYSLSTMNFIQWLSKRIAVSQRLIYCSEILAVVILNAALGIGFWFFQGLFRIGLKKKDLSAPVEKNGLPGLLGRFEKKLIDFFNKEVFFLLGKVLKYAVLILSVFYSLCIFIFEIPAVFRADWISYDLFAAILKASYAYPILSLIILVETAFFLEGVKRLKDECPDYVKKPTVTPSEEPVDLKLIDEKSKSYFKDYFLVSPTIKGSSQSMRSAEYCYITQSIARAVENNERDPHIAELIYLNALDRITCSRENLLINGSIFSEFSLYLFRYLSGLAAKGENILVICSSELQAEEIYRYFRKGYSAIHSLYCKDSSNPVDFDDTIWSILKISGSSMEETHISEASVLITTLSYISSRSFEENSGNFINLLNMVIVPDALSLTLNYRVQLCELCLELENIVSRHILKKLNALLNRDMDIIYKSERVRYLFFDDSRIPGLDKAIKNLIPVDFETSDIMKTDPACLISCFGFSPEHRDGKINNIQLIENTERIGLILNLAVAACSYGAKKVNIFSDDGFPYNNIMESLKSNISQLPVLNNADISLNNYQYLHNEYSVVIVFDGKNDLPRAIKKYSSIIGSREVLLIIVSKPYLFRDYYVFNIDDPLKKAQIEKIPVIDRSDRETAHKILVMANNSGISEDELFSLTMNSDSFKEYAVHKDVRSILIEILSSYGIPDASDIYRYFEYSASKELDAKGRYSSINRIHMRKKGQLYEILKQRNNTVLLTDDSEYELPVSVNMLSQKYITHQNLIYDGNIYYINSIDIVNGAINAQLAFIGNNDEAYEYIQDRLYRLDYSDITVTKTTPTRHLSFKSEDKETSVEEVFMSVFSVPMEVITKGYYILDPDTMLKDIRYCTYCCISDEGDDNYCRQSYRRYGSVRQPYYSSDDIMLDTELNASEKPARVMSIRIKGRFGKDINKIQALAGVMLNEIIHSMYPSVADCIAVCPVYQDNTIYERERDILGFYPKLSFIGEHSTPSENEMEFLIIEDCKDDIGVLTALADSGSETVKILFSPVYEYLDWYINSKEKSRFLYFGSEKEPECFDFEGLYRLAGLFHNDTVVYKAILLDDLVNSGYCIFCGRKVILHNKPGRCVCDLCKKIPAKKDPDTIDLCRQKAEMFLESIYGVSLRDRYIIKFVSAEKIKEYQAADEADEHKGNDLPYHSFSDSQNTIFIEEGIPLFNTIELIVREMTHLWQKSNCKDADPKLLEGHIALVSLQYYGFYGRIELKKIRAGYYESTQNNSGIGYRSLIKLLLQSNSYSNNPFEFLLFLVNDHEKTDLIKTMHLASEKEFGKPYISDSLDRFPDSLKYFYYDRLKDSEKELYDLILCAVKEHSGSVEFKNASEQFKTVFDVVKLLKFDHPELFFFNSTVITGDTIKLKYGADTEETELLQRKIDTAAAEFLKDITSEMSAYDALIRLHVRMINHVDYDGISLRNEKIKGGSDDDKIDYLRTICGVFLEGKAVCEGYARAMQYLAQKCGIECAECSGHILEENGKEGGGHAWNIVKLDGDYYYLDTTWCDQSNTLQTVKKTAYGFEYFCITTEELLRSRNLDDLIVKLPVCNTSRCSYYYHNDLILEKHDLSKLTEIAQRAVSDKQDFFVFKCASRGLFEQIKTSILESGTELYSVLQSVSKNNRYISDRSFKYSYDDRLYTITIFFKYK